MVNEVAQWAAIAVIAFLWLGLYAHVGRQMADRHGTLEDRTGPAVGRKLQQGLRRQLRSETRWVCFVEERCAHCQTLLARLWREPEPVQRSALVVARTPSDVFLKKVRSGAAPVVADRTGDLFRDLRIEATPTVLRVDSEGTVLSKSIDHRVDFEEVLL